MFSRRLLPLIFLVAGFGGGLTACGRQAQEAAPAPVKVGVLTASASPVMLSDELPGRVVAFRTAEIRPQVGGIVQRLAFTQGANVAVGQLLFQISPSAFQADANSAAAALARAEATFENAQGQVRRLKPLVASEAISVQTFDNAVAAEKAAHADVAQAKATWERRKLDLRYAAVTSPISGRIGAANVTEGALVNVGDAKAMATVQQIDQVYIDVRQPVSRIEALRGAGRYAAGPDAEVEIVSTSGEVLPVKGHMLFSDITIDPDTGDGIVRILVRNDNHVLLPGMFVRTRLPRALNDNAIRVPQQAVSRDGAGKPQVHIVGPDKQVRVRTVVVADVQDGQYVILSGLNPGESVMVEGMDRLVPGAPVLPVPWRATKPN